MEDLLRDLKKELERKIKKYDEQKRGLKILLGKLRLEKI